MKHKIQPLLLLALAIIAMTPFAYAKVPPPLHKKTTPPEVTRAKAKAQTGTKPSPVKSHLAITFPKHKITPPARPIWRKLSRTTVYAGSLKSNIIRIARHYGWRRVVWTLPNDYRWVGTTHISAPNLQGILWQLLKDYPLQAVFYKGNHVLVIIPRTLK